MHDQNDLEIRGLPGVFVATVQFEDGADVQAESLGLEPTAVYVEHPIQDRTDDEMLAIADAALEPILASLLAS